MSEPRTAIWWIRRDLRLEANPALDAALQQAEAVIPLFILDPRFSHSRYVGEKRQAYLYQSLRVLDQDLRARGGRLVIREGPPLQVLGELCTAAHVHVIFAQEDVSPYARARDAAVAGALPLVLTGGLTVHPYSAVVKGDGSPYTVYTPFSKTWKGLPRPLTAGGPAPSEPIPVPAGISSLPVPSSPSLSERIPFPPGEMEARRRLARFASGEKAPIFAYGEFRDRMDLEGTSSLSPYLRFGQLSPLQAAGAAAAAQRRAAQPADNEGPRAWLNELIWREFYIGILARFPGVLDGSFRRDMRRIPWRNDPGEFQAWTLGRTGYPVVDAAMRQLFEIGWMHNRARMITASFLVKHLLIDWRWGERWFMQHLIDGDPAANNGGWQWTAGTGTDAAPYFRVFNPILQSRKFDPEGEYIRRWVPELARVFHKSIHTPWELTLAEQHQAGLLIGTDYPAPIIEHRFARQRALDAYQRARAAS